MTPQIAAIEKKFAEVVIVPFQKLPGEHCRLMPLCARMKMIFISAGKTE
jgi:hypothetical protein